ncbi:hypothetical protein HY642_03475 [Candidatus Woesearchaeota archaeon]|nr:hypothetical protein [Candidatus Woesearchaeota archaeon]
MVANKQARASQQPAGLDILINQWFDTNVHPVRLAKPQLAIIAKNWDIAKKYFASRALSDGVLDLGYLLKQLADEAGVVIQDYIQRDLYTRMLDLGKYHDIGNIARNTGVPPTKMQLERLWRDFYNGEWTWQDAVYLPEDLGRPNASQEHVDSICNDWLATMAGEKKRAELIQPERMEEVIAVLGRTPRWDTELAQRVYSWWLPRHFHEKLFCFLQDKIGARPDETDVQKYFGRLLAGQDCSSDPDYIGRNLKRAMEITGIKPSADLVCKFYEKHLNEHHLEHLRVVETLTGVAIDDSVFQAHYEELLLTGWTDAIGIMEKTSGVAAEFTEMGVQRAYASVLKEGDVHYAMRAQKLTGVAPAVQPAVLEACFKALQSPAKKIWPEYRDQWAEFRWLRETFPASVQYFQAWIRGLMGEEEVSRAARLSAQAGIAPLPEEGYVLACIAGEWSSAKALYAEHRNAITKRYPEYASLIEVMP